MAALSAREQQVLALTLGEGRTQQETADRLGCHLNTVKGDEKKISAAIARLFAA
jgi:DNA-binding CsgD family transcriptional regulator